MKEKLNPISVKPREIWLGERQNEIAAAMGRYEEADLPIPEEWRTEVEEFINERLRLRGVNIPPLDELAIQRKKLRKVATVKNEGSKIVVDSFGYLHKILSVGTEVRAIIEFRDTGRVQSYRLDSVLFINSFPDEK